MDARVCNLVFLPNMMETLPSTRCNSYEISDEDVRAKLRQMMPNDAELFNDICGQMK